MPWSFEHVAGPYAGPGGGLAWNGSGMLFSVVGEGRIMRFDPVTGAISEVRRHTHHTNGIALGPDGVLFGCQEFGRRIICFMPDGSARPAAYQLDGRFHNSPCDLAVDRSGGVWFSDAQYPRPVPGPEIFPPLDHASVLCMTRVPRHDWKLRRVTYDTRSPRAILFSADEKTLYLAEGDAERPGLRELRAYPIREDGSVCPYRTLHTFGADHLGDQRGIEGMCLDSDGNIVACGGWRRNGPGPLIYLFSPSGAVIATHPAPADMPMRCAFGDADLGSLYVTAGDGALYRAKNTGLHGIMRPPFST